MDVSFSADQLRRVLGSAEGKQLLALLAADGGGRLRQAAEAGVHVAAYGCRVTPDTLELDRPVPVIL